MIDAKKERGRFLPVTSNKPVNFDSPDMRKKIRLVFREKDNASEDLSQA